MQYNARILALAAKYRQFFADDTPGQILATVCPYTFPMDYAAYGYPDRGLDTWDFARDLRAYMAWCAGRLRAFLQYTADLDNDYVPALNPHFGYGVHSAYVTGAEVRFGEDTSWTRPWLTDWAGLEDLNPRAETPWFARILEAYDHLLDLCEGDFALSGFANAGPGDMANAIRGDALFTDLYDAPQQVHALMDKCADALIWLEERIHARIGSVAGGEVTANVWFPGRAPYISEDFNDLIAPAQFTAFGAVHTQRVLAHFGGGFIHHHAKGAHVHARIAQLAHLSMLEQSWDPNCSPPVERLESLYEAHGRLPLMIRCHANDVYRHIGALRRGRVVIMLNADTLPEAREAMRFIRKHSIL